jgi:hypothetical protein
MLDGAALGTLMIGLESVRNASEWSDESIRPAARRSHASRRTLRVRLAGGLRFAADRLDRKATAVMEHSSSGA